MLSLTYDHISPQIFKFLKANFEYLLSSRPGKHLWNQRSGQTSMTKKFLGAANLTWPVLLERCYKQRQLPQSYYLLILWACGYCFFFFNLSIFNWRIISSQYCVGFCHTSTWISHRYTSIPSSEPFSHLPPLPIPLSCYRALGWVPSAIHQIPIGYLFYIW